ncbi:MAG: YitT family protein [Enterococcus sp.]
MGKIVSTYQRNDTVKRLIVVLLTGVTGAIGLNYFLIPANVLSAGLNGLAQIVTILLQDSLHIHVDTGIFIFLLNVPVFVLGFIKLGTSSTIWSGLNVASISLMTIIVPTGQVTDDILMNALVGGVLLGLGAGLSLKLGFTTGGMDIISLVLAQTTGKTVGNFMLMLNSIIVVLAGFIFDWGSALFTIISIFAMTQVVDAIHTSHQKVTAMIVTNKPDLLATEISNQFVRGMTFLPSIGGYSKQEGKMIMMVITRYELYDLEQVVREYDPDAFVNIVATQTVIGRFANEHEQKSFKMTGAFPEPKQKKK